MQTVMPHSVLEIQASGLMIGVIPKSAGPGEPLQSVLGHNLSGLDQIIFIRLCFPTMRQPSQNWTLESEKLQSQFHG